MSTVGDVQYRGGKSSLSSIQWTPPALYGASYMYGTHHLNNYHHNNKSISIMWGFVWYPFKRCFWAASSLSSLQQTLRVSYRTHLYQCLRAASTLSSLQQTLRALCGAPHETHLESVWGSFHTIVTRSDPSGNHEAAYGTHLKKFSGSSCTVLNPVGPRASFGSPLWFM